MLLLSKRPEVRYRQQATYETDVNVKTGLKILGYLTFKYKYETFLC